MPLADLIKLLLTARPAGLSFEAANPRHAHEWRVFQDLELPDGKVLIPGVIDSTTNYIEHPQLVADRITCDARVVGAENVIAGTDCGFATSANYNLVDPAISWAKLRALSDGAELAAHELTRATRRCRPMRVVQISDTHLFEAAGVTTSNLECVIEFVNNVLRPDLVIHTGDIVGLNPDHAGDRSAALVAHAGLSAPVLAVPGNHDVGDTGERPWMGIGVTSERVAVHCRTVGEVPFLETVGDWGFLGLNSQVMGSGLPEEEEQWQWLEETLARTRARSLLLFMHKPLWDTGYVHWGEVSVPGAAPERLFALRGSERLRAVTNGHVHCYRRRVRPALLEVWGPSTAAVGGAPEEPSLFGQCGVVECVLGDEDVRARFRAPSTLDERTFTEIPEFVANLDELQRSRDGSP